MRALVVVVVLITIGLMLSIIGIFKCRRSGFLMRVSLLAVNFIAIGGVAVALFVESESSYDEAMARLVAGEGVWAVQRIEIDRCGCGDNLVVELWEMESSPHGPIFADDSGSRMIAWMFDSPAR